MPRPPRADEAGAIYHALDRENARQTIFRKEGDYRAFERIFVDALRTYPVDLIAYQWLPNHWHKVIIVLNRKTFVSALVEVPTSGSVIVGVVASRMRHRCPIQHPAYRAVLTGSQDHLCGLSVRGAKRISGGAGIAGGSEKKRNCKERSPVAGPSATMAGWKPRPAA